MDVFDLRDHVIERYKDFATSFTKIKADDIKQQVVTIYQQERFWPEPLLQINPNYQKGKSISELVSSKILHPLCEKIFAIDNNPLSLYKHQEEAIAIASQRESYVVTTGTGSGKSLCFFIPLVSEILKAKEQYKVQKTRAIIIYPMNALANSQLEEIDKFIKNSGNQNSISVARYTGQEPEEERRQISQNPPDILLTNFMMLELLMTRQDALDQTVISNCEGLRFLVLDELHTYRGRQGADVALLVRRVRERLSPDQLQCIGTSATMVSEGTEQSKNEVVAKTASKIFATSIPESNVITETLLRATNPTFNSETIKPYLKEAIAKGFPKSLTNEELAKNPLAVWVETNLGMTPIEGVWVRARPSTLTEAVEMLSNDSGTTKEKAEKALKELLLTSNMPEISRCGKGSDKSFFAFKLHQFISGAGNAYTTLEPVGTRKTIVEPQQFLPGSKDIRLFSTHFCRECGQEYHPVKMSEIDGQPYFLARDIDDTVFNDESDEAETNNDQFGFLMLQPLDTEFSFTGNVEDYPEHWLELDNQGNFRLKANYSRQAPTRLSVSHSGAIGSGCSTWFIRGNFKFCLRCRYSPVGSAKDRTRLASLSSEGRSSATTILVNSTLNWMHSPNSGLESSKKKILGFTDNRQDAALQAGHFNDFIYVSLIRSAFLGALDSAGDVGVASEELGLSQIKALGFDRSDLAMKTEWLQEPSLRGFNFQEAEKTLREVLAYRAWFDQRRGCH